jgi:DNA-binding PadR family transcriptional regulator
VACQGWLAMSGLSASDNFLNRLKSDRNVNPLDARPCSFYDILTRQNQSISQESMDSNTTQLFVLGMFFDKPQHGYQLNSLIKGKMSEALLINSSKIYYTLEKLEKSDLVSKEVDREGNRPEKYVYSITDNGREQFFRMIEALLISDATTYFPVDVGIIFLNRLPQTRALEVIESRLKAYYTRRDEMWEAYKKVEKQQPGESEYNHLWMIERTLLHLDTEIEWLTEIRERYDNKDKHAGHASPTT